MKKQDKLLDAIGMVGGDLIQAAQKQKRKTGKIILKWATPAVAAVLVVGVVCSSLLWPGWFSKGTELVLPDSFLPKDPAGQEDSPLVPEGLRVLAAADYPDVASYQKDQRAWQDEREDRDRKAQRAGNLGSFLKQSLPAVLVGEQKENTIFSPLNVYIALAMLTEVTEGESRQQILDLLGVADMDALRDKCKALWNSNYRDDGAVTSILASSVWLDDKLTINQATVERIAKNYYASSYRGDLGSEEMNELLKNWLDEQTSGFLKDQIKDVEMNEDTVLALATTIYYRAKWKDEFNADQTETQPFYGIQETVQQDFLRQNYEGGYLKGKNYQAVYRELDAKGGRMYFILPDQGVDLGELLKEETLADAIAGAGNFQPCKIDFSVPKFDVSSQLDLKDTLKDLGVENVFNPQKGEYNLEFADEMDGALALSKVQHDARVKIDEEGCEAASFTLEMMEKYDADYETVVFKADRPFIFAITSEYDLPLFVGTVYQP